MGELPPELDPDPDDPACQRIIEEQAAYIDSLAEKKEVDLEELPSETTERD